MKKKTSWSISKLKLKDIFQRKFSLIIYKAVHAGKSSHSMNKVRAGRQQTQNKIILQFDKLKQQENHHHQTFISYFIHISPHIILGHGESFDSFSSLLCCSLCYAEMMSIKEYYLDDDESATVHFDNSTTSDWRGDDRLQRPDIRENEHLKSCRLGSSAITRVEKLILRKQGKQREIDSQENCLWLTILKTLAAVYEWDLFMFREKVPKASLKQIEKLMIK